MSQGISSDFEHLYESQQHFWESFRRARIFLTGGSGFVGKWMLEALLWATNRFTLGCRVVILSRKPEAFRSEYPHLALHPSVRLLEGDVLRLQPFGEPFSHIIHSAAPVDSGLTREDPFLTFDTIVTGTRRVLEVAKEAGARRFLLIGSGAVYGYQPADIQRLPEEFTGAPDLGALLSAYGEAKRAAELFVNLGTREAGIEAVTARCFTFAGPYLPFNSRFAIGNFVSDALRGRPVTIRGDGTPVRSYLYGADMAHWLWAILSRGTKGRAYNVGSESPISISELAYAVCRTLGVSTEVHVERSVESGIAPSRYVPSTARARAELDLVETFGLEHAIRRMAE